MLLLLPPSERKAEATIGAPLDLATLSFPALTPMRERVLGALVAASTRRNAARVLGVTPGLAAQVARNAGLREAPAQPATRVYTGVLYEALGLADLTPAARRRADEQVVIVSALFGALRPRDAIPAYRLSMDVALPRVGTLAAAWRAPLGPVLVGAAGDGLIVDCRSASYAAAWKPSRELASRVVHVRALREQDGRRTVVSHMAKRTRGEVARALLSSRREHRRVEDIVATLRPTFAVEATPPARPGLSWTIDVIVHEV